MQVGNPEFGELFGIALALFSSPLQMALEKAAPAVLRVDVMVAHPVHRPGCLRGVLQNDFVDQLHVPAANPVAGNSKPWAKFPVFPGHP